MQMLLEWPTPSPRTSECDQATVDNINSRHLLTVYRFIKKLFTLQLFSCYDP
jgi:hypothetical protein